MHLPQHSPLVSCDTWNRQVDVIDSECWAHFKVDKMYLDAQGTIHHKKFTGLECTGNVTIKPYTPGCYQTANLGDYSIASNSARKLLATEMPSPSPTTSKVPTVTPSLSPATTAAPTATSTLSPQVPTASTVESRKSCFAGSETVLLESGETRAISLVQVGDRVLAANAHHDTMFSEVIFIPHGTNMESTIFVHLTTVSNRDVKMTPDHILPSGVCGTSLPLVYASKVSVGDCIHTVSGEEEVLKIEEVLGEGVYTIVTNEEYIVVNSIITSSFGGNHMMANLYYNVHRLVYAVAPSVLSATSLIRFNEVI